MGNVSTPHRHEGGKKNNEISKEDPQREIFERMTWLQKRNGRVEMRAVPLFSQKAMISDLILSWIVGLWNSPPVHCVMM